MNRSSRMFYFPSDSQSYNKTQAYFSDHTEDKSAAAYYTPGLLTQTI